MQRILGTGEVAKLSGLNVQTIKKYCREGVVAPLVESSGTGQRRGYSIMQALGLHYARLWSIGGARIELLASIVGFFDSLTESKLRKELEAGRKYLIVDPAGNCKLLATTERELSGWMVNVQAKYEKILEDIDALQRV